METLITGVLLGAVVASVAGFKVGGFVERLNIREEHITLTAKIEAYEKILQVSTIKREIK